MTKYEKIGIDIFPVFYSFSFSEERLRTKIHFLSALIAPVLRI